MPGGPQQKFQDNRRKADALFGEAIVNPPAIISSALRHDDTGRFEFLQPVGQDIRGDAFAGEEKLLIRLISADHEVSNNEQGPSVPEQFERDADRAAGAWMDLPHLDDRNSITCKMQVKILR